MGMEAFLEAGVRVGYMVSKLDRQERETGDLRQRAARLPPEQQFTFALMQTSSLEQLWRTVDPEALLCLTAGLLEVAEEELRDELDEAVRTAWERLEDLDAL